MASLRDSEKEAKEEFAKLTTAEPDGFKCDWTRPMGGGSRLIVKGDSGWILVGN